MIQRIFEKLMLIEDDVDLIYDLYFKDIVSKLINSDDISNVKIIEKETDTSILKNPLSKKAHKENPATIKINKYSRSFMHYDTVTKTINLSINMNAIEHIIDYYRGDINKAFKETESDTLKQEFEEQQLKSSIYHELVHWLDDSLNFPLRNRVANLRNKSPFDVYSHPIEIQALIHNIRTTKRYNEDIWDDITFNDLVSKTRPLKSLYKLFTTEEIKKHSLLLKRRMHREGLLGKNMVKN